MLTSVTIAFWISRFHRVRPAVVARLALERAMRIRRCWFSKPGCEGCAIILLKTSPASIGCPAARRHPPLPARPALCPREQTSPSSRHRRCCSRPARPELARRFARQASKPVSRVVVRELAPARQSPALHRLARPRTSAWSGRRPRCQPRTPPPPQIGFTISVARFAGLAHEPARPPPTAPRRRWRPASAPSGRRRAAGARWCRA